MDPHLPTRGIKGEDNATNKLERRETAQKLLSVAPALLTANVGEQRLFVAEANVRLVPKADIAALLP